MKTITYLPKFYDKADVKAKQVEIEEVKKELLATGCLNKAEIEFLKDANITLYGDAYSRNYIIQKVNELIKFVNYRDCMTHKESVENLSESEENFKPMTLKEYGEKFLDGNIDVDVYDNEIDMGVAFVFDCNKAPKDYYEKFLSIFANNVMVVDELNDEWNSLTCDFSGFYKPYNKQINAWYKKNGGHDEFEGDEGYYDLVLATEGLVSGYYSEEDYKELCDIFKGRRIKENLNKPVANEPYKTINEDYSYSDFEDYVRHYIGEDDLSLEEIWEEIYEREQDVDLANDVTAELEKSRNEFAHAREWEERYPYSGWFNSEDDYGVEEDSFSNESLTEENNGYNYLKRDAEKYKQNPLVAYNWSEAYFREVMDYIDEMEDKDKSLTNEELVESVDYSGFDLDKFVDGGAHLEKVLRSYHVGDVPFTAEKWEDGKPVIKYFDRDPKYVDVKLTKGENVVVSNEYPVVYKKYRNGWVLIEFRDLEPGVLKAHDLYYDIDESLKESKKLNLNEDFFTIKGNKIPTPEDIKDIEDYITSIGYKIKDKKVKEDNYDYKVETPYPAISYFKYVPREKWGEFITKSTKVYEQVDSAMDKLGQIAKEKGIRMNYRDYTTPDYGKHREGDPSFVLFDIGPLPKPNKVKGMTFSKWYKKQEGESLEDLIDEFPDVEQVKYLKAEDVKDKIDNLRGLDLPDDMLVEEIFMFAEEGTKGKVTWEELYDLFTEAHGVDESLTESVDFNTIFNSSGFEQNVINKMSFLSNKIDGKARRFIYEYIENNFDDLVFEIKDLETDGFSKKEIISILADDIYEENPKFKYYANDLAEFIYRTVKYVISNRQDESLNEEVNLQPGDVKWSWWLHRYLIYKGFDKFSNKYEFEDFGDALFDLTAEEVSKLKDKYVSKNESLREAKNIPDFYTWAKDQGYDPEEYGDEPDVEDYWRQQYDIQFNRNLKAKNYHIITKYTDGTIDNTDMGYFYEDAEDYVDELSKDPNVESIRLILNKTGKLENIYNHNTGWKKPLHSFILDDTSIDDVDESLNENNDYHKATERDKNMFQNIAARKKGLPTFWKWVKEQGYDPDEVYEDKKLSSKLRQQYEDTYFPKNTTEKGVGESINEAKFSVNNAGDEVKLVLDSYDHMISIGEIPSPDDILYDIIDNYDQDIFKDGGPFLEGKEIEAIKSILRSKGLEYKEDYYESLGLKEDFLEFDSEDEAFKKIQELDKHYSNVTFHREKDPKDKKKLKYIVRFDNGNKLEEDIIPTNPDDDPKAHTFEEIYEELKVETENFTIPEGFGTYLYDTERAYAKDILTRFYEDVKIEDTLIGETTVYIVTFNGRKVEEN